MHKIHGAYCAALTPVNEDYSINNELYLNHCNDLLSHGLDGVSIFGTTGEANSFSVNEKIKAINYLLENNMHPDKLIIGSGLCSIKDSVLLTKTAAQLKVKAVLVLPAFFYKNVTNEGVIEFYKRIVEDVGNNQLKYILYNFPKLSGVSINFKILEKLIKLYPNNIVGMKDSSGDLDNMLKTIKYFDNFCLFAGSDSLALKICQHGGAGAITATSNISGKLLSFLVNNYKNQSNIENFKFLQNLQLQIRNIATTHEPISVLKAFLSVKYNEKNWNRIIPPLEIISNPKSHKTIIGLIDLIKKMDELLANA